MRHWVRTITLATALAAGTALPASAQQWFARFSGLTEPIPNASPGTGFALLTLMGNNMRVQATFSGLLGPSTVAHVHCCTAVPGTGPAGVATPVPSFPGFPTGVTAGSYDQVFDLTLASSWNPAYITANGGSPLTARTAYLNGLNQGRAYFNVHSSVFPQGEINGYLVTIPEPSTYALLGTGLLALGMITRRSRARR
ncbi:MAG: CHRD domain-containing protein [Gemmatimonadaceae bacterium]|jgi:hypothetical protein|nr:CHRD domain-containing protein [Gemmatimonadaceae bacterium]